MVAIGCHSRDKWKQVNSEVPNVAQAVFNSKVTSISFVTKLVIRHRAANIIPLMSS